MLAFCCAGNGVFAAPTAWFVDGYHGGIYGHYPPSFTRFMVDALNAHPDWKLNLEIEPVTWDFVQTNTPEDYAAFLKLAADQSVKGRIEFVNPAYGQSYLWTASGESMIQQFHIGMRKIREHFTNAEFQTYSSEEPCFTSALPGILKSFGFDHAVLKNPNTCWGGYTRAFGGELVNWIGPDGTGIPTVPRYAIESLKPGSTWETMACANAPEYVDAAIQAGIQHPVGMCLQDAGWRFGPWLDYVHGSYEPSISTTWRNYFENIAIKTPGQDWHFNQEDVQVSLVWGSQVLQGIARNVHRAENRIVAAEKLATLASVFGDENWPEAKFENAWESLLLSQHHDCWIVPYNGRRNNTWADKVAAWTSNTVQQSSEIARNAMETLAPPGANDAPYQVRVFNTLAIGRTNAVIVDLPEHWAGNPIIKDQTGKAMASQGIDGNQKLLFSAPVPPLGYEIFVMEPGAKSDAPKPLVSVQTNGCTIIDTDLYRIELDPAHGGVIRSLVTKQLSRREWCQPGGERSLNELRGYFTQAGKFFSSADNPARIEILENGPVRAQVRVTGQIASNPFSQVITVTEGQRRIDCHVRIDWQSNVRVGSDFETKDSFHREHDRKAFYDDRFKLQVLFPVSLKQQKIFKDAPFDVTASKLPDTFFDSWRNIKNNIILNWVDAFDPEEKLGFSLFTDHTTSYAHGPQDPLGLTLLFSGVGLWGRDYHIHGPTDVNYSFMPHAGNWDQAQVEAENGAWNEPLLAQVYHTMNNAKSACLSLLAFDQSGWVVPTMRLEDGKVIVRLFNATERPITQQAVYAGSVAKVEQVQLNGAVIREIPFEKSADGKSHFRISLPGLGVGTLRITR